ncbi:MAG: IPExxxVDY family protein [Sphingobacteriaceae bacterium]|nr:IPExxxVDY family protein [Sphingobacteriaceae bacterium]
MAKVHLKSHFDFDFTLILITSTLRSYTLCHKINLALDFSFEKVKDHEIYSDSANCSLSFACFENLLIENEVNCYLVANRNSQGFLIPEMNKVDYFMILQHFNDKELLDLILKTLNSFAEIQVAILMDPLKLKSKENLLI